ncbi:MAG: SDR family oxidoreductase [Candidatus Omnitrophica bacterium]|nr:SDR family oxidoreductase [Candidatus Omnitrophota bacterium]
MKNEKSVIFLTGTTGLVGSYLMKVLLENGHKVFALARDNILSAQERVTNVLKFWGYKIKPITENNLVIIKGDIAQPFLGIQSKEIRKSLSREVNVVIHSAALLDFRSPLNVVRDINVKGTKRILDFVLGFKNIKKINYLSTIFIIGKRNDVCFSEDMLSMGQEFNNTYEQSKYEAELLINEYRKKGVKISVFRPSAILGHRRSGKTNNFHLFYESLKFFSRELYDKFPGSEECSLNYINVNDVADAIYKLKENDTSETYHLLSLDNTNSHHFIKLASEYFGFHLPEFISLKEFNFNGWTPAQRVLAEPFIPYINYTTKFSSEKTIRVFMNFRFNSPKITDEEFLRIFKYCTKTGFMRRKRIIVST